MIWASSEKIGAKLGGLSLRTQNRLLNSLEALGLIWQRRSSNSKRYAIKKSGQVVAAWGVDLTPLFAMASNIYEIEQKILEEKEARKEIKAHISKLASICKSLPLSDEAEEFISGLRNLLRRVHVRYSDLSSAKDRLCSILDAAKQKKREEDFAHGQVMPHKQKSDDVPPALQNAETYDVVGQAHGSMCSVLPADDLSGSAGQNGRHIESDRFESKETRSPKITAAQIWMSCSEIASYYPTAPTSLAELREIVFSFSSMMKIETSSMAAAVAKLGWAGSMAVLDYLAVNAAKISYADAYLRKVTASPETFQAKRYRDLLRAGCY